MRSAGGRYRSLEEMQHEAKEIVTPYWRAVSYLSMWLLLGGFLMMPTTFDSDPQLRFSSGVIIVLVVAFLTAGYSLTVLLYFAVPSPLFQLESLLIPSASASFFGLCAAAWTLVSSPRFNPALPGCPITLGLTFLSVVVYGGLGLWTSSRIKDITRHKPYTAVGNWQDSSSANYNPYYSSSYPLTARSEHSSAYYAHSVHDYSHQNHEHMNVSHDYAHPAEYPPAQMQAPPPQVRRAPTEEDMVGQQMASLLAKPAPTPSPDATQQTFRLEWPAGDEETTMPTRSQSQLVGSASKLLSPEDASKHARNRSGSEVAPPVIRIGRVASPYGRGRKASRSPEERVERARSRDERRREIERNSIA